MGAAERFGGSSTAPQGPGSRPGPDPGSRPGSDPGSCPGSDPGSCPGSDGNAVARRIFAGLPDRYDRLAEWLSFGQNARWRAALVESLTEGLESAGEGTDGRQVEGPGRVVLDVATGTAGVALALRKRTGARVVGVDLSRDMLKRGFDKVRQGGTAGIALALARGEALPVPDASVDALSFTYLLRYVDDPAATLAELARVVRPGGAVASLEFCVPRSPLWFGAWWLYTRTALPAAGLLTGGTEWYRVGRFLGPSISDHYRRYPIEWTVGAWEAAGIREVTVRRMSLGGGVVMWGRRR